MLTIAVNSSRISLAIAVGIVVATSASPSFEVQYKSVIVTPLGPSENCHYYRLFLHPITMDWGPTAAPLCPHNVVGPPLDMAQDRCALRP